MSMTICAICMMPKDSDVIDMSEDEKAQLLLQRSDLGCRSGLLG